MANFGPDVLGALAFLGDKYLNDTFETQHDPCRLGFHERVDPNDPTSLRTEEGIELFKNAIFKILMLRARNDLIHRAQNSLPTKECGLSIKLTFDSNVVHPGQQIIPSIRIDPDDIDAIYQENIIKDAIKSAEALNLACGSFT